ncbi:MAG: redox-regulated ATPase YchF [Clostridiales bacterium]|nr:redox-regulated ATPase YchF [Clostridiales bacterium]
MKLGVIGLPNVGKSTLFNALTQAGAQAANYPFCTIEPNVGVVCVPDPRLDALALMHKPEKVTPATIEFVDIAGLVRGASRGEGLGNKFLSHIREVDAVVHVVRCFADENVIHVDGSVDPIRDVETINLELIFADMETVEKRLGRALNQAKGGDKKPLAEAELWKRLYAHLESGQPVRTFAAGKEEQVLIHDACLLTSKPCIYAANISEEDIQPSDSGDVTGGRFAVSPAGDMGTVPAVTVTPVTVTVTNKLVRELYALAQREGAEVVTVCARLEEEISQLAAGEKDAFLAEMGIAQSGLTQMISACYRLLGLISFLTAGPKEVRAWTIPAGARAPQAAGKIHTDFERGFIRAEVVGYDALMAQGNMTACREKGQIRSEGKDYVVRDGDVILFRFNV